MLPVLATASLTAALAAAVSPAGPCTALTAHVNDPLSHGALGDGLLSLDEAIRLLNGTLTPAQLSAAEAAQLSGAGTFVDCVELDPGVTPTITLEAPTTAVTGSGNGMVRITGLMTPVPGGTPLRVTLAGGAVAHVLALRTNEVRVEGLHLQGGQLGVDVNTATMGPTGMPMMAMLHHCELTGQTSAGVQLRGGGADRSGVMVQHCRFRQMPRGVLVDDQTTSGRTMAELEHVRMDQVDLAAEQLTASQGGAMSMLMFFRSQFTGGRNFVRARRAVGSVQQFMIRVVHCTVQTSEDAIDVEGVPTGLTMVHHHVSDIHTAAGFKAMHLWPKGAIFDYHGTEVDFEGDVLVQCNLFTQRVYQHNVHYRNGTLTFDCDGSLPNLLYNKYDNCQIVVPSGATAPVRIRSSELLNTTINGGSLLAPVTLEGCHSSNLTLGGQASELQPAAGPFLAEAQVTPTEVTLGGTFDLISDVPAGVQLNWIFTVAIPRPNTVQEPFPFYGDPMTAVVLPGWETGQNSTTWSVPNNPVLLGFEAWVQPAAVPLGAGQPFPIGYHFPRGGRLYVKG